MRRPLIAGNWKMNGSFASIATLTTEIAAKSNQLSNIDLAVFPPFVYLPKVTELLADSNVKVGAQTVSEFDEGAYTGEVAASMLKELSCRYVLLGHSERRHIFAESDEAIMAKYQKALSVGLTPILCVGETLEQRDSAQTLPVVQRQLAAALKLTDNSPSLADVIIAYEPVWAIGTGKTATPEQAEEVHAFIRGALNDVSPELADRTRLLYGGSMKPENAEQLLAMPNIDGGLIGGASLSAEKFIEIGKKCNK